jgi:hypothetical protein
MNTRFFPNCIKIQPLALFGMVMLLGACRPTAKGGLPTCPADVLRAPDTLRPGWVYDEYGIIVDSTSPTFTWTYPDSSCSPEFYDLRVDISMEALESDPAVEIRIDGASRAWIPADPLNTGTAYYWQIKAGVGDRLSGWEDAVFRTGPECVVISPGTMSAPNLLWPPDGSIIGDLHPTLQWEDPTNCIPPGDYKVEVDTSPAFTHPFEGGYFLPHLWINPPWAGFELEDCTRYYWRVRINLRDRVDSEDGPWSDIRSFSINESGICAGLPITRITPIPPFDFPIPGGVPGGGTSAEPSSWISGTVWHDLCAVPYESTDVAPPGCVWVDDSDGYWANGIHDSGEPGLAGVTVDLGMGACPTVGLATAVTRSDGHYSFGPLAAGTYCVSINALSDANISVLIPGSWTSPIRFAEPAMQTILLGGSEVRSDSNFGWDFQFLPAPSSGPPTARLLRNSNCRSGPSIEYRSLTTLFQGLEVPIDGRNLDSSWWWVRIPNSTNHCWLAKENVLTSGNTGKVPIVEAEALGCWVWTGNKNECKVPCPEGAQPGGACEP